MLVAFWRSNGGSPCQMQPLEEKRLHGVLILLKNILKGSRDQDKAVLGVSVPQAYACMPVKI